jgi:8-oxo-dGTP pyrophosphatase MutT (NUDIX family)
MVLNNNRQVLVIREARSVDGQKVGFGRGWKLPGGLADLGEDFAATAQREVWEETGITSDFLGIVGFRHQHDTVFGRSDLYFVCEMALTNVRYPL